MGTSKINSKFIKNKTDSVLSAVYLNIHKYLLWKTYDKDFSESNHSMLQCPFKFNAFPQRNIILENGQPLCPGFHLPTA